MEHISKLGKSSTVRLSWEFKTWQLLSARHGQCLPPVGFSEGGSGLDHGLPGSSTRTEPGKPNCVYDIETRPWSSI